jgi:hypothetical protein
LFGGEFYTGSKTGVHTCLEESFTHLHRLKSRCSYLFGGEFHTGSKIGVHACLEENFTQVEK